LNESIDCIGWSLTTNDDGRWDERTVRAAAAAADAAADEAPV